MAEPDTKCFVGFTPTEMLITVIRIAKDCKDAKANPNVKGMMNKMRMSKNQSGIYPSYAKKGSGGGNKVKGYGALAFIVMSQNV